MPKSKMPKRYLIVIEESIKIVFFVVNLFSLTTLGTQSFSFWRFMYCGYRKFSCVIFL